MIVNENGFEFDEDDEDYEETWGESLSVLKVVFKELSFFFLISLVLLYITAFLLSPPLNETNSNFLSKMIAMPNLNLKNFLEKHSKSRTLKGNSNLELKKEILNKMKQKNFEGNWYLIPVDETQNKLGDTGKIFLEIYNNSTPEKDSLIISAILTKGDYIDKWLNIVNIITLDDLEIDNSTDQFILKGDFHSHSEQGKIFDKNEINKSKFKYLIIYRLHFTCRTSIQKARKFPDFNR